MVNYKELRIAADSRSMLIDIEVSPYSYYDNMYISQVCVDTDETFVAGSPSSEAKVIFDNSEQEMLKHISVSLCAEDLDVDSFQGHVFYVYAACGGAPDKTVPCMMDMEWTLGVVLDWRPVYSEGMDCIREIVRSRCSLPKRFIDYALRFDAFNIALQSGQYPVANELFHKWFANGTSQSEESGGCGCG